MPGTAILVKSLRLGWEWVMGHKLLFYFCIRSCCKCLPDIHIYTHTSVFLSLSEKLHFAVSSSQCRHVYVYSIYSQNVYSPKKKGIFSINCPLQVSGNISEVEVEGMGKRSCQMLFSVWQGQSYWRTHSTYVYLNNPYTVSRPTKFLERLRRLFPAPQLTKENTGSWEMLGEEKLFFLRCVR